MKKTLVLMVLVVVVGALLTAAKPVPPAYQTLEGTLRWQRASVCGVSDFVALPVMTNVYLTGNFAPTRGLVRGCTIGATGYYYDVGACTYFAVEEYTIRCGSNFSISTKP